MKKLLLFLALAAAGLQGWADEYYLVGGCTDSGWSNGKEGDSFRGEYPRSAVRAYSADGTNWAWVGYISSTADGDAGRFKIPNSASGWDGIWAPEQDKLITAEGVDLSTVNTNNGDYKFRLAETGYYLIKFNTNAKKIYAQKLTAPSMDGDYYCISSVDDYYYFAAYIASNDTKNAKARLTADLSFEGKTFVPMASDKYKFCGEFDGKGHTIDYAVVTGSYRFIGLFTYITGKDGKTANIHDLVMGEHCSFTGSVKVGGIAGFARDGGEVKLTNIVNKTNVISTGGSEGNEGNSAGFIACATDKTIITATNCGNMGLVSGQDEQCAAFAGWTQDNEKTGDDLVKTTFTNCWNSGTIYNTQGSAQLYRNTGKVTATNCYDASSTASRGQGTLLNTSAPASGELGIRLNSKKTSGGDWYQTVGTDNCPVPFSSPSHATLAVTPTDGWYEISQPWQLRWMAEYVTEHNSTYGTANIKLTDDIDYSAYTDQAAMFGKPSNTYKGTFDGQKHTVTVAFVNNSADETGLFRRVNAGKIQNLRVAGSISTNKSYAGGICSGIWQSGTIKNCESAVTITDNTRGTNTDVYHGGILAQVSDLTSNGIFVENCLFSGTITAPKCTSCAGIVSSTTTDDAKKGYMHIKNNLVAGTLNFEYNEKNGVIVRKDHKADFDNNYYACTVGTNIQTANATNASSYKTTGELCYKLNGSAQGGTNWYQNLSKDKDDYPFPFNTHGTVSKSNTSYTNLTVIEGYVQINDKEDLYTFSAEVAGGQTTLNAELKKDIEPNNSYTPIGTSTNKYKGEFNGNCHTVTFALDNSSYENQGLFGIVTGGTNIHDLVVDGYVTAKKRVAGIIGYADGRGTVTLNKVINKATIYATDNGNEANAAGLVGCAVNNAVINATNCANTGNVSNGGSAQCAAFAGWTQDSGGDSPTKTTFTNCWNSGTISNYEKTAILYRNTDKVTQTNCYHVTDADFTPQSGTCTKIGTSALASGELCYKLNGSSNGGTNWYQNLSGSETVDAYPVPFDTHDKVYLYGTSAYVSENSQAEIGNATDLKNFATLVNSGLISLNAKLTANIDMTGQGSTWTPIGFTNAEADGNTSSDYANAYHGTFDGDGHTIDNLVQSSSSTERDQGLFGVVTGGCTIQNLILGSGCHFYGKKYVGAFVGSSRGPSSGVVTIQCCGNEAAVNVSDNNAAAFFGVVVNTGPGTIIRNCYNTGNITGGSTNDSAILTGWFGNNSNVTVENFYNIGTVTKWEDSSPKKGELYRDNQSHALENVYHTSASQGATEIEDGWLTSGELCYKLKGEQVTNVFTQDLSQESYPTFGSEEVKAGQWFNSSENDVYYNKDASDNITVYQLNLNDTNEEYKVPAKVTAKNVKMTRTLHALTADGTASRWNTFCSPVALAKSNFTAIKKLTGATKTGDNYTMTFGDEDVEGDYIVAGRPYMVQVDETKSGLTATNVAVAAAGSSTSSDTFNGLTFNGNFISQNAPTGSFIISNNVFYNVDSTVALKAFRGYITVAGAGVKALNFNFDDDATSINEELRMKNEESEASIFNLAGQRINKVQKGINIVNGRKVLF